jgi:hypothetical protein
MAMQLIESVRIRITKGGESLYARVTDALVEKELADRAATVIDACGKLEALDQAIRRIKPDQKQVNENGELVSQTFSQSKYDELKKLKEQRDKLDKLIDKAFTEHPDFPALKKAADAVKGGKVVTEESPAE